MNNAWKACSLLLLSLIIALSLIMVKPSFAQSSIPIPSVPEFTMKLVAHPYDVAPVTTTDPYTGKIVTRHDGYHVENKSVEITIKNQPLHLQNDGNYARLYYNISYKGHYETDWYYSSWDSNTKWFLSQSNSDYTVISLENLPDEGQVDYRVQAQFGSFTEIYYPMQFMDTHYYVFNGSVSGWSNTQTLSLPDGLVSASSSSEPTVVSTSTPIPTTANTSSQTAAPTTQSGANPIAPQLNWLEVGAFLALGTAIALLVTVVALLSRKIRVLEGKLAT